MIVGSDEKTNSWMDEGLTDFYTSIAEEDFHGNDGPVKRAYSDYIGVARRGAWVVSRRHTDTFPPDWANSYGAAAYGKPNAVMHQLRGLVGEETFNKAMRLYTQRWAYKHPYPLDLFNTFKEVHGESLDWYFRTWMYESWNLDQAIASVDKTEQGFRATIENRGLASYPTQIEATYEDGRKERVEIPLSKWYENATQFLDFGPGLSSLRLDPDTTTLDYRARNNRWSR